ncbi:MAG: DUF2384 domain-containing protein [Mitsuaria chitosanitabida]|uniref:antitoxin Xre/MbcA/ParS toxin-binding domain-containing protein n=1 Tax=Roseateles chitosanitabidus TaxID=65048 RepID=UPI001B12B18F|nr:DUF2384 domain-containing protein [Roseateles chitosanitabidus]
MSAPAVPKPLAWPQIVDLATSVFETRSDAAAWLVSPHPLLGWRSPEDASRTAEGASKVREFLVAMRHGGVV